MTLPLQYTRGFRGDHPLFESGQSHHQLKGGSGREGALNGSVLQRQVRVLQKVVPLLLGDPHGELIGIKRWPAGHRQDFSSLRVECHHGSWAVAQLSLSQPLEDRDPE